MFTLTFLAIVFFAMTFISIGIGIQIAVFATRFVFYTVLFSGIAVCLLSPVFFLVFPYIAFFAILITLLSSLPQNRVVRVRQVQRSITLDASDIAIVNDAVKAGASEIKITRF